jgi:hypothetical protein
MVPCRRLGHGRRLPPWRHHHRPRRGEPSLLCAHAHAHNLTTTPGTGPGASPGTCSRGGAAAAGPEHGAGHSFLWPPPNCPRTSVGQSPPRRPSYDTLPPPSPRLHRRRCLARRKGPLPSALDPTPASPGTRPPLQAPGGKVGDRSHKPPTEYACSGHDLIFFVDTGFAHRMWEPRPGTPPPASTLPKNFMSKIWPEGGAFLEER